MLATQNSFVDLNLMQRMKSVFDKTTRDEIIDRINAVNENSAPQWGKMNVYQMLKHCALWEEMLLGKKQYPQSLLGRLFGRIALKSMLKDEPMKQKFTKLYQVFKISGRGDVAAAKAEWIKLLREHEVKKGSGFVHPFFGKLTAEQAGYIAYKHIDHHLRQFNS